MPTDCQFPHDARHPWQFMVRCFWLHIQTALFLVNVDTISGHYREKSTVVCAFYRRLAALVIWKKRKSGKKPTKNIKSKIAPYIYKWSAREWIRMLWRQWKRKTCTCVLGTKSVLLEVWWRHQMKTFSSLLALCVGNSPVTGEFPSQRPVTRSFDVFFVDLWLNKRLSKHSRRRRIETPSRCLWRHCNGCLRTTGSRKINQSTRWGSYELKLTNNLRYIQQQANAYFWCWQQWRFSLIMQTVNMFVDVAKIYVGVLPVMYI